MTEVRWTTQAADDLQGIDVFIGPRFSAWFQNIFRLFGGIETIDNRCDMRIRVCGLYLEEPAVVYPNSRRTRRSYTRLITPLSRKTLIGWKVEFVTLGFDFDGVCFLVPDGVSLLSLKLS